MEPGFVSVTFRKQLSDGNYGSETAEVTFNVPADADALDGMTADQIAAHALIDARRLVHAELDKSPSGNVRRALKPPEPRPQPVGAPDDLEDLPY